MARRESPLAGARITRGALVLLIATTAVSLAFMLVGADLQHTLFRAIAASGDSLWRQPAPWQVATSPLLEPELIGLLFQGFMLWMFLPQLERWWGTRKFLVFA